LPAMYHIATFSPLRMRFPSNSVSHSAVRRVYPALLLAGAGGWTTNFAAIRLRDEHRVIRRAGLARCPAPSARLEQIMPFGARREDGNGGPQCQR
jgi:hypothetical protein